jgi:hypothetical protein
MSKPRKYEGQEKEEAYLKSRRRFVKRKEKPVIRGHTEESRQYSQEQLEFLKDMQELKNDVGPHPTWPQVLAKAKQKGYRKFDKAETDQHAKFTEDEC